MLKRGSGVLMHISSLPSDYGIGDLGPESYRFVDFLKEAHQAYWQMLPLNPTEPIYGNSPYSSHSAFAVNGLFISPEMLVKEGWLSAKDLKPIPDFPTEHVDYLSVSQYKNALFDLAASHFASHAASDRDYQKFCEAQADWLEDYALFWALKENFQKQAWVTWPEGLRRREAGVIKEFQQKLGPQIQKYKFLQYTFFKQWFALKSYCKEKGVRLIGDIPIYVNHDSADVWANPEFFKLDENGQAIFVAGVPPDYFSQTGQRWGNPVYDWEKLKETGYAWWFKRIRHNLNLFDVIRIDHFRGFVDYWEIPAEQETAIHGQWQQGPGDDFLNALLEAFPDLPIIAEDLGILSPAVYTTMEKFNFPGMKILLFAFGGEMENNPYLPEKYAENSIVYTGTHDNNTAKGWLQFDAGQQEKDNLLEYFGKKIKVLQVAWDLIELAETSVANIAIIPLQDLLNLGKEARMNTPATAHGNWEWRLSKRKYPGDVIQKLSQLAKVSGRASK